MSKLIPSLIKLYFKLASDPDFKNLIYNLAVIEGRWLSGELEPDVAFDRVMALIKDYFFPVEFKAL